jgi:hypothetical protein
MMAAACLLAAVPGCRRATAPPPPAPRPRLEAIELEDASRNLERSGPLDVEAIAGVLRRMLVEAGIVRSQTAGDAGAAGAAAGGAASAALRVTGRVGFEAVEVEAKGILRCGVALQLTTKPSDAPGAVNQQLSAAGEQRYDVLPEFDRARLGQRLVERTAADLLGGFLARVKLATATPAQVHAAIVGDGGSLRSEAIQVSGARGLRDEIPTLLTLLHNDDESIRDAALGALIALRERRAVTELTRSRSLRDRHEMRKILEAIAILGGDEANDYLSFVAQSHDDEEIRKLAADAKGRLDRRAKAPQRAK